MCYIVTMYMRTTKREYKDKTYTNHILVESVYTPKGPRQRTVCSLGDLKPRSRTQWLKLAHKVEVALVGQGDLFEGEDEETQAIVAKVRARQRAQPLTQAVPDAEQIVSVVVDEVQTEEHRQGGPVHVGCQFWKRLRLDAILEAQGLGARTCALACAMVLNRLIEPKPEYAMPDWVRSSALQDLLDTDFSGLCEDALYRTMDKLEPHRAAIESALVEGETTLFSLDRTVFFYDLTSTYFEGLANNNPKAKRGYSRDKRPDCKQVVVALAVNRDGFPMAHEVFEGNVQDRATLPRMLDAIDQRVGLLEGQTVVVDRGMAYPENMDTLRTHPKNLHFIVATRQSERDQFLADFEDLDGFEDVIGVPSPQNPFQNKSTIRVKIKRLGDETCVLCISSERIEKDRAIREKQEQRLLADLVRLERRIEKGRLKNPVKIGEAIGRIKERYPRVARYYRIESDADNKHLTYPVDDQQHAKAQQLDGSYLLRSNRNDLSAEDAWRTYMLLTRAENAFRDIKSPLVLRPVHHQVQRRVDTHIFLSLLAYHLLVAIEKTLLDQGVHSSWATLRDALKTHQVCTVVLPTDQGDILRIRKSSTPEPLHRTIYDLLHIPTQIIRPRKTWTRFTTTG